MRAKEYLIKYQQLKTKVTQLEQQIEEISSQVARITASYSLVAGITGGKSKDLGDGIAKLIQLQEKLHRCNEHIAEELSEIILLINGLPIDPTIKLILQAKYIQGMDWKEIGRTYNITNRRMYYMHVEGLKYVDKVLASRKNLRKN